MPLTKYDAFLSYRHLPFDKKVAIQLQKLLEHYRPPRGIEYLNTNKITRIFRDETELPTSGDLGADICTALENASYLVVLCSPKLPESKWCLQEIEYFKKLHGGRTNRILSLLVDGSPSESFPQALQYDMRIAVLDDGTEKQAQVEVEPLAANISGGSDRQRLKKLNIEFLRIAATILGCPFDGLYGRHQRRARRRIIQAASMILALATVFIGTVLFQYAQTRQQKDLALRNQSLALADRAIQVSGSGDKTLALLLALEALPADLSKPEKPFVKEAQWALFESVVSERSGLEFADHYDYREGIKSLNSVYGAKWSVESTDGSLRLDFDYFGAATITNMRTGRAVRLSNKEGIMAYTLDGASPYPEFAFFSPRQQYIVLSGGLSFAVFNTSDGAEVFRKEGGSYAAAFRDDETAFAFLGGDTLATTERILCFVDLTSGSKEVQFIADGSTANGISTLAFSKNNRYLLSAAERGMLTVWDAQKGWSICLSLEDTNLISGYFSEENQVILVLKNGERHLFFPPGHSLPMSIESVTHPGVYTPARQFVYNSQENKLCIGYGFSGAVKIFDAATLEEVCDMPEARGCERVISHDGRFVLEYRRDPVASGLTASLRDVGGRQVAQLTLSNDYPSGAVALFSDNYLFEGGMRTVSSRKDGKTYCEQEEGALINLKTNQKVLDHVIFRNLLLNTSYLTAARNTFGDEIAVSRDGQYYFHGNSVFEAATGKPIIENINHVVYAGFTKNYGGFYVQTDTTRSFYVIDSGEAKLCDGFLEAVPTVLSETGKYAAGFDEDEGYIWDVGTGELISQLALPEDWYSTTGLSVSLDGLSTAKALNFGDPLPDLPFNIIMGYHFDNGLFIEDEGIFALIAGDGRLIFWDINTGGVLAQLAPTAGKFQSIALSGDGLVIQSEHTVNLIDYKTDVLQAQAKKLLHGRTLTAAERTSNYCEIK